MAKPERMNDPPDLGNSKLEKALLDHLQRAHDSSPNSGAVIYGAWRQGLKDLQNNMIPAFPNQQQPGVSEAGTIANPTQLEVYQEKRRESPDQEYGYQPQVTPRPEHTTSQGQEQQEATSPGLGPSQEPSMLRAMEQAGSENGRHPVQEVQESDLGQITPGPIAALREQAMQSRQAQRGMER